MNMRSMCRLGMTRIAGMALCPGSCRQLYSRERKLHGKVVEWNVYSAAVAPATVSAVHSYGWMSGCMIMFNIIGYRHWSKHAPAVSITEGCHHLMPYLLKPQTCK